MKNSKLFLLLFTLLIFSSCSESNNPSGAFTGVMVINETVEGYPTGSVFEYHITGPVSPEYPQGVLLYSNTIGPDNKFILNMTDLSPSQLVSVRATELSNDSNTMAALWNAVELFRNDSLKGVMYKANKEPGVVSQAGHFYESYVYMDAPRNYTSERISITAGDTFTTVIDCNLKKGWNTIANVYNIRRKNHTKMTVTTQIPTGAKWYYISFTNSDAVHKFPDFEEIN